MNNSKSLILYQPTLAAVVRRVQIFNIFYINSQKSHFILTLSTKLRSLK